MMDETKAAQKAALKDTGAALAKLGSDLQSTPLHAFDLEAFKREIDAILSPFARAFPGPQPE